MKRKIVRYYIESVNKDVCSNWRLLLQKDNSYSGGTFNAKSFRFLFLAKLFVARHKPLCLNSRIVKQTLYHDNNPCKEDFDAWSYPS